MKNKVITCIVVVSLSVLSGCAKKDNTLPPIPTVNVEMQENEDAPILYFTQGVQSNDEELPWNYTINPGEKTIEVEWVEWIETETDAGLVAEQTFRVHTTDLFDFEQSDSIITFSYLDEEAIETDKKFDILSDSIVKDENNTRYEWLSFMRQ